MPHSENDMALQVNGDKPSSAFLSHLTSYPIISDSISTFKANPYGAKSLDITTSLSTRISSPFLPYLSKPYQYVSPYVAKADSLGDSTLSTFETKFPLVKKPTGELYSDGKSLVFFPLTKSNEGKEYVFKTYNSEVKKVGGQGVVSYGKAAVSTTFIVGGEAYNWLTSFLSAKKAEAKEMTNEKMGN